MFTILLHSSKTMRTARNAPTPSSAAYPYQRPALLDSAIALQARLQKLSLPQLESTMGISRLKAVATKAMIDAWSTRPEDQLPAIDAFIGDIYSGLQVQTLSQHDRQYANQHLVILSGLYGALKACDSIAPYRLEMAYKLPGKSSSLYDFWGHAIADQLPAGRDIINVSSVEYTRAVLPYRKTAQVVTPKFLTRHATTGVPTFVTVHAKIARGAFAHWLITNRITSSSQLHNFDELNYRFDPTTSTTDEPVFICDTFGGLGLSVRLT